MGVGGTFVLAGSFKRIVMITMVHGSMIRGIIPSLLLSATTSSASTHHSTFITMARSLAVQHRRSARLQKRSLASDDLSSLKVSELRDLLREKGLVVSGVKSVLIERLLTSDGCDPTTPKAKRAKKKSVEALPASKLKTTSRTAGEVVDCLPRTRELQLQSAHEDPNTNLAVIGVDEAGRGPLAGYVSV